MSTNHYLDILGLEPGADKKAIKKAYRTLSKRFHPDINPNPEAHQRFIEINEAYKFLTMAGPSPYASQNSTAYDYDPYQKAYDEWRKQAREFARAKAAKLAAQRKKTILTTINYFKYFAAIVLVFSSILIIDFFLPESESEVKVYQIIVQRINYDKYDDEQEAYDMAEKIIVTDNSEITIIGHLDQSIENYLSAFLHHTPIFKKPTSITFEVNDSLQQFKVVQQIYQTFSFFVWVNFFLSLAFFFVPVNPSLKLNFAIVMSVFFILEIMVAVF